jgi:general stress protein 26
MSGMPAIDKARLLAVMRQERYAVQASVGADGTPQAALVGVVFSDSFEVVFDTLGSSRKAANLRRHPRAALGLGPAGADAAQTVQLEGLADEPRGADLDRLLALYFERFPDGRERQRLPDITYWRVRPTWIRVSDYTVDPPHIVELASSDLG